MNIPLVRRVGAAFLGLLCAAQVIFAQVQTVIVNDTFSDGERTLQQLPGTAAWFSSSSTSSLAVSSEALSFVALTGSRHALAHFPAKSLAVGESLEFSFDFRSSVGFIDQGSGIRFGLFSTNGANAISADAVNTDYTFIGYAATTNGNPTSNPTVVRKRSSTSNPLITSTGSYSTVGNTGGPIASFLANVTYRATLLVEKLEGNSARLTVRFTGGSLPTYVVTVVDSTNPISTFDTLAIAVGSSTSSNPTGPATTDFMMDNVSVIHIGPTPPAITAQPVSVTVAHADPAVLAASVSGSAPMSFQWYRNGQQLDGQTSPTLWFQSVSPADAGEYTLVAANAADTVTTAPATLTVTTPAAPTVRAQPISQTVVAGGSATFSVAAGGSPPLSYQWLRNGVVLSEATSATLQLDNISASQAGFYSVKVSNSAGTANSTAAALTVIAPLTTTTLLNDTFSGANVSTQNLPTSAAWLASSASAPTLGLQSGALLVPAGRHALAYFTAPNTTRSLAIGEELTATFSLNFSVAGQANGGFRVGLYNSNGAARATNGSNAAFVDYAGVMAATSVRFPTLDSANALAAYDSLSLRLRIPNYPVGGASTALISTTAGYSPAITYGRHSQSFATGVNYQARFSVIRAAADRLRVSLSVTGPGFQAYAFEGEVESTISAFDSFAILSNSTNGSTFTMDNFLVTHSTAPVAVLPTILTHPRSVTVQPGESLSLAADATGTPVPTIQWRRNEVPIEGATGSAFHLASVTAEDAGNYDVVVTNSAGSVTSNVAVVTVGTPMTPLQSWRVSYFGSAEATGNAADLADPDADGLANLVEYALGFDPTVADSAAIPAAAAANGNWVFNYTRPVTRPGVTYFVEVSTNLSTWTTTGVTHEEISVTGDTATWQARHTQTATPVLFFRLRVSPSAP